VKRPPSEDLLSILLERHHTTHSLMLASPFLRVGQRFGPEAVRSASHLLRPYNPDINVTVFGALSCVDYGDVSVIPGYIEDTYTAMEKEVRALAEAGVVTLGFGGDHSVTLGELRALAKVHGPMSLVRFRLGDANAEGRHDLLRTLENERGHV
jgi:arginase family enzyme